MSADGRVEQTWTTKRSLDVNARPGSQDQKERGTKDYHFMKDFMRGLIASLRQSQAASTPEAAEGTLQGYVMFVERVVQNELVVDSGDLFSPLAEYYQEKKGKSRLVHSPTAIVIEGNYKDFEARNELTKTLQRHIDNWRNLEDPVETANRIKTFLLKSFGKESPPNKDRRSR